MKKAYPECEKLGVLRTTTLGRRTGQGRIVVSSSALYKALGWDRYKAFLPHMKNVIKPGLDPDHVEAWLRENPK